MADKQNYYNRISLKNKTSEEAKRIQELFDANRNIAYKVASKYYSTPYWDYDEALQIAQLGLWKACLIWDPDKYKISTLAYNIITRDFIDFDKQAKKQPDILFNLEDNCVTDNLSLNDVLVDEDADIEQNTEEEEGLQELSQDILYILDDISEELKLQKSVVKIVYLVYVESSRDSIMNIRCIDFIPRATIKQIISLLQQKLKDIL